MKSLIHNFISALKDEIEAIKKGKNGSVVKVTNGKFIRQDANFYIYSFILENFLYTIDDAPIELKVGQNSYKGQVVQIQDQEVIIAIEVNLGSVIPEAKVINDLSFLLEKLKDKLKDSIETGSYKEFKLANAVFKKDKVDSSKESLNLKFEESNKKFNLNESQQDAVMTSQLIPLTYVWGPPGTGKTHTLARIAESFIKRNFKVLLASHSNAAVDGAIKGIAEVLLKTNYYSDGELIRLGSTSDEEIESKYNLVLLEKVVEKQGKVLTEEKNELINQLEQIDIKLSQINIILEKVQDKNNIEQNIGSLNKKLKEFKFSINYADREAKVLTNKQDILFKKLDKAKRSNSIMKFVLGLDVEKIQNEIDHLQTQILNKENFIKSKKEEYAEGENKITTYKKSLLDIENIIIELLKKQNLKQEEFYSTLDNINSEKDKINIRINEIEKELDILKIKILNNAKVVGTTLTKTFLSKELENISFDVLILDEASMALVPQIYWALTKCSKAVVIIGDFLQLPPICMAKTDIAKEYFAKDIYQYMDINLNTVDRNKSVKLLNTQYRMHPKISAISREIFYKNKLEDGNNTNSKNNRAENISKKPLTIIDTSSASPWCSRPSTGSRFNIYNAILSARIAELIVNKYKDKYKIGIISPYKAQVKLIRKVLDDLNLSDVQVSTVHRFQGSEKDIIIFDTVESHPEKIAGTIDDKFQNSDAKLLLNVALTRAESQFILLGNIDYLERQLPNRIITQIIQKFKDNGEIIDSKKLIDTFFVNDKFNQDFEKWAEEFLKTSPALFSELSNSAIHSEKSFYPALFLDLKSAKEEIIIFSPFISIRKSSHLIEIFRSIVNNGIKIKLYTKPISQQGGTLSIDADKVIKQLENIGIEVIQRSKMHQKVVIIDKNIAWTGSLNILSHKDTGEQMVRISYPKTINELINNLELDSNSIKTQNKEIETYEDCSSCNEQLILKNGKYGFYLFCKNCSNKPKLKSGIKTKIPCSSQDCDGEMIVRYSKKGWFLGCSNYPDCKSTQNL